MSRGIRVFRDLVFGFVRGVNRISMGLSASMGQHHQLVIPYATYAPWLKDQEFLELFRQVEPVACTSLYQCWELWELVQQNLALEGDVLEVGVWKGATGAILGKGLKRVDSRAHLFCCDTFRGLVKSSESDPHLRDGALEGPCAADARDLLERLGVENFTVLEGVFPEESGAGLESRRFKLCHIDVDTRRSAEDVTAWVVPRLPVGGVIVFQDYGYHRTGGISSFVDDLKGCRGLLVVHNLNGSALVVKTEQEVSWPPY